MALPGETLAINQGDIWIDGAIARKSLPQLKSMAILLNDSRHAPTLGDFPRRWQSSSDAWCLERGRYCLRRQTTEPLWLDYHHWAGFKDPAPPIPRTDTAPVWDIYGYNQDLARGNLHRVHDVWVAAELTMQPGGKLWLRAQSQGGPLTAVWDSGKHTYHLTQGDRQLASGSWTEPHTSATPCTIDWAVFDHQAVLAIDDQILFRVPYEASPENASDSSIPISLSVTDATACFARLRVYRDLHYLGPDPSAKYWNGPEIEADRFFVLGDNVPTSIDSRFEAPMGIPVSRIRGQVIHFR